MVDFHYNKSRDILLIQDEGIENYDKTRHIADSGLVIDYKDDKIASVESWSASNDFTEGFLEDENDTSGWLTTTHEIPNMSLMLLTITTFILGSISYSFGGFMGVALALIMFLTVDFLMYKFISKI